jgi:hypothetical protein
MAISADESEWRPMLQELNTALQQHLTEMRAKVIELAARTESLKTSAGD